MAWHFGLGDTARAVQNAKRPRRWPLVVSARPGDSSAAVAEGLGRVRATAKPSRALARRASAIAAAVRAHPFVNHGAEQRRLVFRTYRKPTPSCVSNGARLGESELNFELLAHALKEAARAREMAHQRPPETPQHPPRRRATAAGPPSLPPANVSPRAPPRRRKVPRRSESGTRRRTRPAGGAARSPSTCRRRCAPRAATRAPRCAGLTGPRKRCGGARTARAACAT